MRITCPNCGERDRREFYVKGAALARPDVGAGLDEWHSHLHLRDNPAGETKELWYHEMGCSAWIEVCRNTVSHKVVSTQLALAAELGGKR